MPFNLYYGYQPSRQCSFWHTCKYTERSKEIDFITLIFVGLFLYIQFSNDWFLAILNCLMIIITHADNARAFNITKIIRWMINSLIIHIILMLSWKNKCFLSWKDTTLPFYNSQPLRPYINLMLYSDTRS